MQNARARLGVSKYLLMTFNKIADFVRAGGGGEVAATIEPLH